MTEILSFLEHKFKEACLKAFPALDPFIEITESTQDKFGHYQFNSSMKMAKQAGMNPRAVAEKVVSLLDLESIDKVEIAGPGFINIFLKPDFIAEKVEKMIASPRLDLTERKKEKIIVEFSSPNIAKELHVGHLRSTIIGDSIARLFEFLGAEVIRINHVGDWGTQFGMLIGYMKEKHPLVFNGEERTDLSQLMGWYKESKALFDKDAEFKKRAQAEVVKLQRGEKETLAAWAKICEISRKGYQEIYDLLDVKIEEKGESFYNPMLPKIVEELEEKNLITVSEGAKCVFLEGFINREGDPLPLMVQKTDGGYNYDTTDLAALKYRIMTVKADRIIYVTDVGQSLHFQMIFQAGIKAGWYNPKKTRIDHVGFGLVLGPDGKKFKTRSGETEKLIDLLTKGIEFADQILQDRSKEMDPQERKDLAHALGLSAIKYSDLSSHRTSDYVFSYEKMLKFEGNTAAYMLYSYVRINGIKRKVGVEADKIIESSALKLEHPSEIDLALHIARFEETLHIFEQDLLPNRLTDYLYRLADKFNAFFRDCRVEGAKEMGSRLKLCWGCSLVMQAGFSILGIPLVEKM